MPYADKHTILKQYFGYEHFRDGQEHLIDCILSGKDCLGVMPTGAGKSICFQVPAVLLNGITLVISPLISLMKDQVNALTQVGIKAAFLNSSLTQRQYNLALDNAKCGIYKIIYVAPERLLSDDFLNFAQNTTISMITIDEAHCISQWGQDFRPSYIKIVDFIRLLPNRPVISAFTATATAQVRDDIIRLLNLENLEILVTGFDRGNLYFEVQKPSDKFAALIDFLKDKSDKAGIIYCSTRKTVEEVCQKLIDLGYPATRYHAGLSDQERIQNQDDFIFDKVQIIVATNAFGMGIDKSNVSYVVHYNMPKNIESYYQEAGRAGRDGEPANCILFYNGQDVRMNLYFIENSKDVEYADMETELLVKARDRERLKEMTNYRHTHDCLREYILNYFGDTANDFCGNCSNCNDHFETIDVTVDAQKILSCITRTKERYGVKMIIDVLRGSKNEKVLRLGLDKLSTYNILSKDEKHIRDVIHYLVLNEYLMSTNDEYPVLKLGDRSNEILRENKCIQMKLDRKVEIKTANDIEKPIKKQTKKLGAKNLDSELLVQLKNLRLSIANQQKVPAFVVFSDSTLTDMCMKCPTTEDEFLSVSGVGKVKLDRYGALFLTAIAAFVEKQQAKMIPTDEVSEFAIIDYDEEEPSSGILTQITEEPIPLSVFVDAINCTRIQKGMTKISAAKTADWLIDEGYLQKIVDDKGVNRKVPTHKGEDLGIVVETRLYQDGNQYCVNLYNKTAQEFLIMQFDRILPYAQCKGRK